MFVAVASCSSQAGIFGRPTPPTKPKSVGGEGDKREDGKAADKEVWQPLGQALVSVVKRGDAIFAIGETLTKNRIFSFDTANCSLPDNKAMDPDNRSVVSTRVVSQPGCQQGCAVRGAICVWVLGAGCWVLGLCSYTQPPCWLHAVHQIVCCACCVCVFVILFAFVGAVCCGFESTREGWHGRKNVRAQDTLAAIAPCSNTCAGCLVHWCALPHAHTCCWLACYLFFIHTWVSCSP